MATPTDLDDLTRRTRRAEFEDGLNDLHTGLVFLLLGLLSAFFLSTAGLTLYVRALVLHRELTLLAVLSLLPLFVLLTFGARRAIVAIRRRWIWKGRGQVVPLRVQVDWRVSLGVTAVWLLLAIGGMIALPRSGAEVDRLLRPMVAATGIATGILYFALGRSLRLDRYLWVGAIGALLSSWLAFVPWTFAAGWTAVACLWAGTLFVSGGLALALTLRRRSAEHG